jgi:hypothetical protein
MIINPFTGQLILNHPGSHDQKVHGGNKKIRSLSDSYEALDTAAESKISYDKDYIGPTSGPITPFQARRTAGAGDARAIQLKDTIGSKVSVLRGPREREVAAHEAGHVRLGHVLGALAPRETKESEAWRWALKNAKKLGLSKRKIRQVMRQRQNEPS